MTRAVVPIRDVLALRAHEAPWLVRLTFRILSPGFDPGLRFQGLPVAAMAGCGQRLNRYPICSAVHRHWPLTPSNRNARARMRGPVSTTAHASATPSRGSLMCTDPT